MLNVASVIKCLLVFAVLQTSAKELHQVGYQLDARASSPASHKSYPNATESLFSQWSSWSPCSHSCGIGISMRSRSCQKSLANSKSDDSVCLGDLTEHKICKLQVCPTGTPDPRASQCSRYNNRHVAGQRSKVWIPIYGGSNPCELRCQAEGIVSGFGKVADGTPCNGGICLDGRCLSVGCDERLGSGAEYDMCGVCRGRNTTCVHYNDVFYGQFSVLPGHERRSDYQEVVVIPVGARNLKIRQDVGNNILAIRDRQTAVLYHGKERHVPNEKIVSGAVITYSQEDNNRTEVLKTKGPTTSKLYVLVLLRERNPGIRYDYWLPVEQSHVARYLPTPPTSHPTFKTTPYQIRTTQRPYVSTHWRTTTPSSTTVRYNMNRPASQQYHKATTQISSTKLPFNYGPKRRGLLIPHFNPVPSSTSFSEKNIQHFTAPDGVENFPLFRSSFIPRYNSHYRTRKPVFNYYEKFRNVSYYPTVNIYKRPDYLPQQTQRDSGSGVDELTINSRYDILKAEKHKLQKYGNFTQLDNGKKWKYTINGRKNDSLNYLTTPVSIAVLPLPETKNYTKTRRGKRRGLKQTNSRPTRGESCAQCQRVRDQTKHFCTSDFVIRASVVGYDFIHGETRYELEVLQSFKNTFALLSREYIWSPDTCRCPKLRIGKEYLLMGRSDNNYRKNESRLLVDRSCFVRNYNHKYDRRLLRLRKDQARKCSAKVS